jgi:prophage antirepressor-like protein
MTQQFNFQFQNYSIRAIEKEGELWFVAKDIADALGYGNSAAAVSKILIRNIDEFQGCQGVTKLVTPGGEQEVTILNEFGMYSFCMLAKTDTAVEFRKFVRQLVVEWRKSVTGEGVTSLVTPELPAAPPMEFEDILIATLQQLKVLRKSHDALYEYVNGMEQRQRKVQPLLPGEKAAIRKTVSERMKWLTKNAYSATFPKLYSALNRRFEVSSYKEIPSERLDEALSYVKAWRPPGTPLQEQIDLF